jgi:hypothetical protein
MTIAGGPEVSLCAVRTNRGEAHALLIGRQIRDIPHLRIAILPALAHDLSF